MSVTGGRSYETSSPRTSEDDWLRIWNKLSGDPDSPVSKDLNSMFSRAIHSSRVSFSPRNLPFIWRAVSPKRERGRSPRRSWAKGRPGGASKSQDTRPKLGKRSRSRSPSPRRPRSATPPRRVVTVSPVREVAAPSEATEGAKPKKSAIKGSSDPSAGSSRYTIPKISTARPYVPTPIAVPKPSGSRTRTVSKGISTSSSSSSSSSGSDVAPTPKEKIKLKIQKRKLSLQKQKLKLKQKKRKEIKSASRVPSSRSPTPTEPPVTPGKGSSISTDVDLLLDTAESF